MSTFLHILLTTLISIILLFITFVVYMNLPATREQWFRKFVYKLWGYGPQTDEDMFYSHKFTDLFKHGNPFSLELGISIRGIHLVRRRAHGFKLQREFYTMNMIRMVTINESYGRIARVFLMIEYSPNHIEKTDVGRYFKVNDARKFYEKFLDLKYQYSRLGSF